MQLSVLDGADPALFGYCGIIRYRLMDVGTYFQSGAWTPTRWQPAGVGAGLLSPDFRFGALEPIRPKETGDRRRMIDNVNCGRFLFSLSAPGIQAETDRFCFTAIASTTAPLSKFAAHADKRSSLSTPMLGSVWKALSQKHLWSTGWRFCENDVGGLGSCGIARSMGSAFQPFLNIWISVLIEPDRPRVARGEIFRVAPRPLETCVIPSVDDRELGPQILCPCRIRGATPSPLRIGKNCRRREFSVRDDVEWSRRSHGYVAASTREKRMLTARSKKRPSKSRASRTSATKISSSH